MLARTTARTLPIVNRTADHAPMAATCCNTCRVCVSSNLIGVATGGFVAVATVLRRLAARRAGLTNA